MYALFSIYNRAISVYGGIPVLTSLSEEYPRGKTVFLFSAEKDIVFPQNNVDLELRRRFIMLAIIILGFTIPPILYFKK
jgi:hypothetical protein